MVYLDHNATTPPDARVREAMLPWLSGAFGNPSSPHRAGRLAKAALELAREQVAALVRAHPSQVIFTSGGTEANNLAIKGVLARRDGGLAISAVEHPSVSAPAAALAVNGTRLTVLPVDGQGRVAAGTLGERCSTGCALVSVMMANNETGVVQDIPALAGVAREIGALFHTDAVQAAGKIPVDFTASGVQLMSLSAHKLYGPQGTGALVVDKGVELEPLLHGGGQERGRRSGTENLAAIVGFGQAAELAASELAQRQRHLLGLRQLLEQRLKQEVPAAEIFSEQALRLPNTLFLSLLGIDGETLVLELDRRGIAVASGSACGSGQAEPSHVLAAMGIPAERARGAIRISLGRDNGEQDIEALVAALAEQTTRFRAAAAWA